MDEPTTPEPAPAHDSRRSEELGAEEARSLSLFPPYAIVLLLCAALSVLVATKGAAAWHEAQSSGSYPEQVRRDIVFSLVFTYSVVAALLLAWLGELVATAFRLRRGLRAAPVLGRLGLSLLPFVVFGIGHWIVNPWLFELVGQARQLMGA